MFTFFLCAAAVTMWIPREDTEHPFETMWDAHWGSSVAFTNRDYVYQLTGIILGRTRWAHIIVTRDSTNRMHVARCMRCGQLISAATEPGIVERTAANHHCEAKSKPASHKNPQESGPESSAGKP